MRAFLAVSQECIRRRPDHDARIFGRRVREQFYFSDSDIIDRRYTLRSERRLGHKPTPNENPEVADEHTQACQNQEFGKLAASDIPFGCTLDRKFVSP